MKVTDTAQDVHGNFSATAVYSEIALLEAMEREPSVVKMLDYGVSKRKLLYCDAALPNFT